MEFVENGIGGYIKEKTGDSISSQRNEFGFGLFGDLNRKQFT